MTWLSDLLALKVLTLQLLELVSLWTLRFLERVAVSEWSTRQLRLLELRRVHLQQLIQDGRSEEHTSELQSRGHLVCRLLLEKKKKKHNYSMHHKTNTHTTILSNTT